MSTEAMDMQSPGFELFDFFALIVSNLEEIIPCGGPAPAPNAETSTDEVTDQEPEQTSSTEPDRPAPDDDEED